MANWPRRGLRRRSGFRPRSALAPKADRSRGRVLTNSRRGPYGTSPPRPSLLHGRANGGPASHAAARASRGTHGISLRPDPFLHSRGGVEGHPQPGPDVEDRLGRRRPSLPKSGRTGSEARSIPVNLQPSVHLVFTGQVTLRYQHRAPCHAPLELERRVAVRAAVHLPYLGLVQSLSNRAPAPMLEGIDRGGAGVRAPESGGSPWQVAAAGV